MNARIAASDVEQIGRRILGVVEDPEIGVRVVLLLKDVVERWVSLSAIARGADDRDAEWMAEVASRDDAEPSSMPHHGRGGRSDRGAERLAHGRYSLRETLRP